MMPCMSLNSRMGIQACRTNEFVALLDLKDKVSTLPPHFATVAVAVTYLTSFANFSTVGMIYGNIQFHPQ